MQKRDLQARDSMLQENGLLPRSAEGDMTKAPPPALKGVTVLLGLLLAANLVAGCSGNNDDPANTGSGGSGGTGGTGAGGASNPDSGTQDGYVSCASPSDPLDTYLPNMSKRGSNGVLTFTLVQSDNAPPIRDRNIWKLKINTADQTQVMGDIVADVKMPKHTHPAGQQPKITFDPTEGVYVANPVFFFMAGYWSAKFTAYQGPANNTDVIDLATFYFCVD